MKEYLMDRKEKDDVIEKALTASKAFKAYNAALAELAKVKTAESVAKMDTLLKAKTDTFQALTDAVTNLTPSMVRELCSQSLFWILHKPLFPKDGGEMGWDQNRANEIVDAMKSIQSALERDGGQFKGNQDRIHLMRTRMLSASAVVVLCRETGMVPRNGLTAGFVECGLKKLDTKKQELYKAGDQKWEGLSKQYVFIQNALGHVLKQQDNRMQNRPVQQQQQQPTLMDVLPEGTDKMLKKHVGRSPRPGSRTSRKSEGRP